MGNQSVNAYVALLKELYSLTKNKHKVFNLSTMHALLNEIRNPQRAYPVILVGGSNGKGSVSLKIAETLRLSGYRTGLYSSPHLSCFRERIRIDHQMIPEKDLISCYRRLPFSDAHSFFERITATAFFYFAQQKIDVAVIEVGLGGRLDATNGSTPLLSVITSISLEHTELLGDSLEKIAKEKLGIARSGTPLVLGPTFPSSCAIDPSIPTHLVSIENRNYDQENQAISEKALEILKSHFNITSEATIEGLKKRPACRMECIDKYLLDVAHNPAGMQALARSATPEIVLLGLSKRKEALETLESAKHFHCPMILFASAHPRCFMQDELQALSGLPVSACFEDALSLTTQANEVLITGSCFIMAEVKQHLGIIECRDPFDLNEKTLPVFF